MKIELLEELRIAGHDVNKLLSHPARFMSVAKIGPKKAYKIYKQLNRPIPIEKLEEVYNKVKDKKLYHGKAIQKMEPAEEKVVPVNNGKVKYPLDILVHHKIPLQELIGPFKVILGTTGMGKSNTVAVIIEEYTKYNLPVHIIDVEGEHLSFVKEKGFKLLNKENYKKNQMEPFLKEILQKRQNLVVDFNSFDTEDESMEFLKEYLDTLWTLEDKMHTPLSIIVEEIQKLVPQSGSTPVKKKLRDFAKRGRKRKIEAIFVTQRSAEADKGVITQAEVGFLHKVSHPTDLAIYKILIPNKELYDTIGTMNIGEVIYVNKGKAIRDMVRKRHTTHGSHTLNVEDLKIKDKEANTDVI